MQAMRITLVEDHHSLRKGITYRLEDEGFGVDAFDDGLAAADFLRREDSDLVILDINLPGQSGLEVLRLMRARDDQRPVIILTARGDTADRVVGLNAGADDYLVKPFAMDELVARVHALGRRRNRAPRPHGLALGALTLELMPPRLTGPDGALDVPRRELALLVALAEAHGTAVSKDKLLDAAYGIGSATDDKVVEVYVSRLRKRLKPFDVQIVVQRGIGYRLSPAGS